MLDLPDQSTPKARGAADAAPLADQFTDTLMRVIPRLGRVFKAQLREGPLTPQQLFVMMEIQETARQEPEGAQPGKLARHCGLSGPGVTAVLDDLVRGGYCRRTHGEIDRRAVYVRLTEDGQRTLETVRGNAAAALRDVLGEALQHWDDDRIRALLAMLLELDAVSEAYLERLRG
jgi:DNA-binding MarR family transcriptional regulator